MVERVRAMRDACLGFDVPLAAAALQFSLKDPRIVSTIVGMSRPERVKQTLEPRRPSDTGRTVGENRRAGFSKRLG